MVDDSQQLTYQTLRQMLAQGETQSVEFKSDITSTGGFAKEVAAMANGGGGFIIIGVGPDGVPVGLSEKARMRARMRVEEVAESILPELRNQARLHAREYVIDSGVILVVSIPDIPDQLKPVRTVDGAIYARRDDRVLRVTSSSLTRPPGRFEKELKIFVAMSFQVDREPALVDYYHAMKRALERSAIKHRIDRVDEVHGDYEVTAKIEEMIASSDIVIADFTLNSPNVYYEAGIARGSKVYTIRTARKDTDIPFDVGTKKFILYANATQLEESLIEPIQRAVIEIEKAARELPDSVAD
ncbi:AlbA family DNA-binding domain-containing protein [Streptomyces sp. NPDC004285]